MARLVQCIHLKKEAEGLEYSPYPGELGKKIYNSVSKEAWQLWMKHQTMLVNENRLNLADQRAGSTWPARWKTSSSARAPNRWRAMFRHPLPSYFSAVVDFPSNIHFYIVKSCVESMLIRSDRSARFR